MLRFLPLLFLAASGFQLAQAAAIPVTIAPDGAMLRGGKPYFIKGAGGETRLEAMVAHGANSFRTWGHDRLPTLLPEAEKLGLTISVGIWLEHECSWFSYSNPEHCERQAKRVREVIEKYKDASPILAWGIGNEMEGDGKNVALWKQLNRLVEMVKSIDPAHPTFTAVAGLSPDKSANLNAHVPKLDFVGINTYGALPSLRNHLVKVKWTRPYAVTEFGPQGFWERPKTPWGAALEQTSEEKVSLIQRGYRKAIEPAGSCIGSYVFIWGQKQEASSTWFGVFTDQNEETPIADAMQELWTGKKPTNSAPVLKSLKSEVAGKSIASGSKIQAKVEATDPDQDPVTFRWQILNDTAKRDKQGRELPADKIPATFDPPQGAEVQVSAPTKPGKYRVHVFALDGKGHAGTANFPIQVE